jgi:thioredoxin-dependent peroxiredoxin
VATEKRARPAPKATKTKAAAPAPAATAKPKKTTAPPAAKRAGTGLTAGAAAPDFELLADDGSRVKLRDFAGKKLVLYFYPKDNTPGCTREACAFQEELAGLLKSGTAVVGVSRDSVATHGGFKKKYGLKFPLLSDPDAAVHRAYGAFGKKVLYGKEMEGALRTTVVIDGKGNVARVFPSVKVDGHVEKVKAALAAM